MQQFMQEQEALLDTPLNKLRWTVFDLETTGINPDKGDVVVEIAAVHINEDFKLDNKAEFHSFVNPGIGIPYHSTLIHGITDEQVEKAPDFVSVYYDFADFAKGTVLVAHNAAKDMAFLRSELAEYHVTTPFNIVVDSLKLSRIFYRGIKHDLESLTETFHLDEKVKGRQHRALPDAKRTALLFRKIMRAIFPKECLQLSELLIIQNMR